MPKFHHYHQPWIDEDEDVRGADTVKTACGAWQSYEQVSALAPTCPECLKHGFLVRWGQNDQTVEFDMRPLDVIAKEMTDAKRAEIISNLGGWDGWKADP